MPSCVFDSHMFLIVDFHRVSSPQNDVFFLIKTLDTLNLLCLYTSIPLKLYVASKGLNHTITQVTK